MEAESMSEDDTSAEIEPTRQTLPDSLDDLAAVAVAEHEAFERDARSAIGHAIRAGEALIAAKARVRHGEWLPWLAAHFPASERTARRYMQLAENRSRVADLDSVRAGLAELAEPRAMPELPPPRLEPPVTVEEALERARSVAAWLRETNEAVEAVQPPVTYVQA